MIGDEGELWVRTAEAVLARGRGFQEAILTADRVIRAYLNNARSRLGSDQHRGPGFVLQPGA